MIEREFYPLSIAAEKIGCTTDDLIHLAANGKVQLVALTYGLNAMRFNHAGVPVTKTIEPIFDRYCLVHHGSIRHFEAGRASGRTDFTTYDFLNSLLCPDGSGGFWNLTQRNEFIKMSEHTLYMLTNDINALLSNAPTLPRLANDDSWQNNARRLAENILKDHPLLSIEQIANKTNDLMRSLHSEGTVGMTGRGGKIPAAETIKRHALKGIRAMPQLPQ